MRQLKARAVVGPIFFMFVLSCARYRELRDSREVLATAEKEVATADALEATNPSEAPNHYSTAADYVTWFIARYPATSLAARFTSGERKIGKYTLADLKKKASTVSQSAPHQFDPTDPIDLYIYFARRSPISSQGDMWENQAYALNDAMGREAKVRCRLLTRLAAENNKSFFEKLSECSENNIDPPRLSSDAVKECTLLDMNNAFPPSKLAELYGMGGGEDDAFFMLLYQKSQDMGDFESRMVDAVDIATLWAKAGNETQTRQIVSEDVDKLAATKDRKVQLRILTRLCEKYTFKGNKEGPILQKLLEMAEESRPALKKAEALASVGLAFIRAGEEVEGRRILLESLEQGNGLNNPDRMSLLQIFGEKYALSGDRSNDVISPMLAQAEKISGFGNRIMALQSISQSFSEAKPMDPEIAGQIGSLTDKFIAELPDKSKVCSWISAHYDNDLMAPYLGRTMNKYCTGVEIQGFFESAIPDCLDGARSLHPYGIFQDNAIIEFRPLFDKIENSEKKERLMNGLVGIYQELGGRELSVLASFGSELPDRPDVIISKAMLASDNPAEALEIVKQLENNDWLASALVDLAGERKKKGDLEKSKVYLYEALRGPVGLRRITDNLEREDNSDGFFIRNIIEFVNSNEFLGNKAKAAGMLLGLYSGSRLKESSLLEQILGLSAGVEIPADAKDDFQESLVSIYAESGMWADAMKNLSGIQKTQTMSYSLNRVANAYVRSGGNESKQFVEFFAVASAVQEKDWRCFVIANLCLYLAEAGIPVEGEIKAELDKILAEK